MLVPDKQKPRLAQINPALAVNLDSSWRQSCCIVYAMSLFGGECRILGRRMASIGASTPSQL